MPVSTSGTSVLSFPESGYCSARIVTYYPFSAAPPDGKYCPQITQTLAAWQYTSKGRVNGISGPVDLNVRYLPA